MITKEPITLVELLALLEEQLNVESGNLSPDMLLADLGAWDSMGVLLVMAEFDERLGLTLTEDILNQLKSIQDIVNIVQTAGLLKD
jgi:acyl carrier protein